MYSFEETAREGWQEQGHQQALQDCLDLHDSDCNYHNEPAFPNSACNCSLLPTPEERYKIVMNNYDADPIDCALGTAEEVAQRQIEKIEERVRRKLSKA